MKKLLLVLGALVIVFSGVAMVSAYEAHTINVKAKVENALNVPTEEIDFGTVFPEEWITKAFKVKHSESFCEVYQGGRLQQGTHVDAINYQVWVVRKPVPQVPLPDPYPDPVDNISGVDYYYWLGDALYIGIFDMLEPLDILPAKKYPLAAGGELIHVTNLTAPAPTAPVLVLSDNITKPDLGADDLHFDTIVVGLDVPVFEGYYNPTTDPEPKPSGLNDPTVTLTGERNVQGIVLGADIVIQVTNIYLWPQ